MKHQLLIISLLGFQISITTNPYKGLKQATELYIYLGVELRFQLLQIPIRDWNHSCGTGDGEGDDFNYYKSL